MAESPGNTRNLWDNISRSAGAGNTIRTLTPRIDFTDWRATVMVPKICSVPECPKPIRSRELCDMHRARAVRKGELPPLGPRDPQERFWEKVAKSDGCWEWLAASSNRGYGVFGLDGKNQLAHRVSWYFRHGTWPDPEMVTDHICNNKLCVNPDHLRELMNWQNLRRAIPRGDAETERRRAAQRRADAKRRGNYKYIPGGDPDSVVQRRR